MPPRYRHVLVAFDGSPEAELALAHAVAIAQVYRARLALVAVVPPPPLMAWQAPGGMRGVHETEQAELELRLRAAADQRPRRSLGDHAAARRRPGPRAPARRPRRRARRDRDGLARARAGDGGAARLASPTT